MRERELVKRIAKVIVENGLPVDRDQIMKAYGIAEKYIDPLIKKIEAEVKRFERVWLSQGCGGEEKQ